MQPTANRRAQWTVLGLPTYLRTSYLGCRAMTRGIQCYPNCFHFSCPTSEEYVYIYLCLTAWRRYMNYRCYQIILRTQIGSSAKCWPDIYDRGADLAVTGRISDIGKKVSQCSFRIGSSSTSSYFQTFSFIACLEEAFIRNVIIIVSVNYTI
jgi:hypothetical protein